MAGTIDAWLGEQQAGGDGLRFWVSSEVVEPTRFHGVRSWKTVHIEPFDYALVRVNSLTESGEPVSKLWKVCFGLGPDGTRPITRLVDAADESMPPSSWPSGRRACCRRSSVGRRRKRRKNSKNSPGGSARRRTRPSGS